MTRAAPERGRLRIGISACLLGEKVRWDGGDKRDDFACGALSRIADLVAVCPEVELGFGVPREPIQLVSPATGARLRLVGRDSGADHTAAMERYAQRRADELAALDLDGYVFKKDSPSCGVGGVRVQGRAGVTLDGSGAFARVIIANLPSLVVVEESDLADRAGRRHFLTRLLGRLGDEQRSDLAAIIDALID